MEQLLLGIDIGTSSCKVAAFTLEGKVAASATGDYPVYYPQPGWVEQNPEEWWSAVCGAVQAVFQQGVSPSSIAAVGIDGQSWSCIPMGSDGNVLYNTPIWMDTRSDSICQRVKAEIGEDAIFRVSGNPFQPSYTTPKILWFLENLPEIYEKTRYFLQSNSYVAFQLTGVFSQDLCQTYGLHVANVATGEYDLDLCRAMGIDAAKLPPVFPCHEVIGHVTATAAAMTGLQEGTPVVAGGLDAACGTLGAGVYLEGQTQEQGGQAGGMSICESHPYGDPALILSNHVVPGMWLLQGGTVGGGASLNWFAKEFGGVEEFQARETGENKFALIDKLAAKTPAGADGMVFLPYLFGERSPIWDPNAKGVFYGLTFDKTRGHFFRAVMEGASFALRHNLECAEHAGAPVGEMYAMGGAANSALWTQIKADVTGKVIHVPASDTATTLGAAILAGVGVGAYRSFGEAVSRTIHVKKTYRPNDGNADIYNRNYTLYRELYEKLKDTMASY